MTTLELPVNDRWLVSTGRQPDVLRQELREVLAAKLYELGRLTLAQAAEMAGLPVWTFMEALSRMKVSVINLDETDLAHEFSEA
ncbi:MAG: UPF0175 family protein [Opitutaceae bacterium]|jgi:predicted HTH domain antitoxin|nr:UPF0175 family protein [Opitutaceae bacterium]